MPLNTTNNHISLNSYKLPDSNDQITIFQSQTSIFRWCLANSKSLSNDQLKVLAQVLLAIPSSGDSYEKELMGQFTSHQKAYYQQLKTTIKPKMVSYELLGDMGFAVTSEESEYASPLSYILQLQKGYQYRVRGISINDKGKYQIEANTLAEYFLQRIPLVQLEDGSMYHYNRNGLYCRLNDNMLKTICRDVLNEAGPTIWKRNLETEYIAALKHVVPFIQAFDYDPDIVNFTNGLLNIRTLSFQPHKKDYYSTNQLAYEYDPLADCPQFKTFLTEVFDDDRERIEVIKELLGYLWVKEIKIQKGFFFWGKGSNGKSVLAKIIRRLVGEQNLSSTSLEKFQKQFGLQELPGKLVNISSENEFKGDFETEHFKQVTSGDPLPIELKYQHAYTDVLYAKMLFVLNRMMDSKDKSNAYYRRLLIIPFYRQYKELNQGEQPIQGENYMDLNLENNLIEELPGIFNFAMEGLQQLVKNNFKMTSSQICETFLEDYKRRQNPVMAFIDDCLEYQEGSRL